MRTHLVVPHELPQHLEPAGVVGKVVVELRAHALQLRQLAVRNVGEIVMFDVVAQVVHEEVADAIVAVSSLALGEEVVFRKEVTRQPMQASLAQQGAAEKVGERSDAQEAHEGSVEGHLHHEVHHLQPPHWGRVLEVRPQSVDDRVQEEPEDLGEGVSEEVRLRHCRDVHVEGVVAHEAVVVTVVLLVGH